MKNYPTMTGCLPHGLDLLTGLLCLFGEWEKSKITTHVERLLLRYQCVCRKISPDYRLASIFFFLKKVSTRKVGTGKQKMAPFAHNGNFGTTDKERRSGDVIDTELLVMLSQLTWICHGHDSTECKSGLIHKTIRQNGDKSCRARNWCFSHVTFDLVHFDIYQVPPRGSK